MKTVKKTLACNSTFYEGMEVLKIFNEFFISKLNMQHQSNHFIDGQP